MASRRLSRKTRQTRKNSRKVGGKCGKGMMNCSKCHASCSMSLGKDKKYTCCKCNHVIEKK